MSAKGLSKARLTPARMRAFIVTIVSGEAAESYYLLAENSDQAVLRAMRFTRASKDQVQDIIAA